MRACEVCIHLELQKQKRSCLHSFVSLPELVQVSIWRQCVRALSTWNDISGVYMAAVQRFCCPSHPRCSRGWCCENWKIKTKPPQKMPVLGVKQHSCGTTVAPSKKKQPFFDGSQQLQSVSQLRTTTWTQHWKLLHTRTNENKKKSSIFLLFDVLIPQHPIFWNSNVLSSNQRNSRKGQVRLTCTPITTD